MLAATAVAQAQWKPDKPITIIVPWAAGGSTDQVTRVTAAELEKALNQKVVILNQPGASGSVGTKNAMEAPKDGYTWTAGAAKDLGTYKVLGMVDTSVQDWNLYLNVAHIAVVGVNADSPYKTMPELLDAMKAKPGSVAVATAGVNSSGHAAIEAIARATGVSYKHVTYDGGNPAVVATVSGETPVTTQLAAEQTDMIRAKKIRPLAVVGDKPLEIEGFGTVPPLSQFIPGFKDPINYFGIFVPKGVPAEVTATLDKIWATADRQQRGAEEVRPGPRRPVRADVRRRGAAGRVPGDPGLCLDAAGGRQGQGLARHGRHRQALIAARHGDGGPRAPTCAAAPAGWPSAWRSSPARGAWIASRPWARRSTPRRASCRPCSAPCCCCSARCSPRAAGARSRGAAGAEAAQAAAQPAHRADACADADLRRRC